jgi:hypothetical protein
MEKYCSTCQSPQRALAPTEEEEECTLLHVILLLPRILWLSGDYFEKKNLLIRSL